MLAENRFNVILAAFLVGSLVIATFALSGESTAATEVSFQVTKPNPPEKLSLLKVSRKDNIRKIASEAASIFGVKGQVKCMENLCKVKEGPNEVEAYRFGGFRYYNSQMGTHVVKPSKYPSDEQCIQEAKNILETIRQENLYSKGTNFSLRDVKSDETIYKKENTTEKYWNNKHVNFDLTFENVSLVGGMAKCRVYLNENGQVMSFFGDFWNVRKGEKVRVMSPTEALRNALGRDAEKVTVKSISLVYYVPSKMAKCIKPSYAVKAKIVTKVGPTLARKFIIPAFER